jgi:hypothetical protein
MRLSSVLVRPGTAAPHGKPRAIGAGLRLRKSGPYDDQGLTAAGNVEPRTPEAASGIVAGYQVAGEAIQQEGIGSASRARSTNVPNGRRIWL